MHTATQLDQAMFEVRIDGAAADREALLPDWGPYDRLGVVVTEPLGAVGASHLIQLAMTAFYDLRPSRRAENGHYPEVYLFHVGRRFGEHSPYDFWPPRKEVFAGGRPEEVLDAINDRAITRLAVVDRQPRAASHRQKDPESARDRIVSAFAYSATGGVANPDVTITGTDARTEQNPRATLKPQLMIDTLTAAIAAMKERGDAEAAAETGRAHEQFLARLEEVTEVERALAVDRRRALRRDGLATEGYRRISIAEALEML